MLKWAFFASLAVVCLALSGALYGTSYKAHALEQRRQAIHVALDAERARAQVLKAEWAYLANPLRLEREARRHLALAPTESRRIGRLASLATLAPTRQEASARTEGRRVAVASAVTELASEDVSARHVAQALTAQASVMP